MVRNKIIIYFLFISLLLTPVWRPRQADAIAPIVISLGIHIAVVLAGLAYQWATDTGKQSDFVTKGESVTAEQAAGANRPPEPRRLYGSSYSTATQSLESYIKSKEEYFRAAYPICTDLYVDRGRIPNPLPSADMGLFYLYGSSYMWSGFGGCKVGTYPRHDFRFDVYYKTDTANTCAEGQVQLDGLCKDVTMVDLVPGAASKSDGSWVDYDSDGVGTDVAISADKKDLVIQSVANPDLGISGAATISKTGVKSELTKLSEKYSTIAQKEDGTTAQAEIELVTEVAKDGTVVSAAEKVTYADGSTPQSGDRLTSQTWINTDGSMTKTDPVPGGVNDPSPDPGTGSGGTGTSVDMSGVEAILQNIKAGQCGGSGEPPCSLDLGVFSGAGVVAGKSAVNTDALEPSVQVDKQAEIKDEIEILKGDFKTALEDLVMVNLEGASLLPSWSFSILGSIFTIDLARYSDLLSTVANFMLFFASISCLFIILES